MSWKKLNNLIFTVCAALFASLCSWCLQQCLLFWLLHHCITQKCSDKLNMWLFVMLYTIHRFSQTFSLMPFFLLCFLTTLMLLWPTLFYTVVTPWKTLCLLIDQLNIRNSGFDILENRMRVIQTWKLLKLIPHFSVLCRNNKSVSYNNKKSDNSVLHNK